MNKLLSLTMVLALFVVGIVSADTYVLGDVTDQQKNMVPDVKLDVTCGDASGSTMTEPDGTYVIGFDDPSCVPGTTAYVTAKEYDVTNSGKVCNEPGKGPQCEGIDLALVNLTIPEFGILAGAAALIGALGIFAFKRK